MHRSFYTEFSYFLIEVSRLEGVFLYHLSFSMAFRITRCLSLLSFAKSFIFSKAIVCPSMIMCWAREEFLISDRKDMIFQLNSVLDAVCEVSNLHMFFECGFDAVFFQYSRDFILDPFQGVRFLCCIFVYSY